MNDDLNSVLQAPRLKCLLMLLALVGSTLLQAQEFHPLPVPPKLPEDEGAAFKILNEKYSRHWNIGLARWRQVERAFSSAAAGYDARVTSLEFGAENQSIITILIGQRSPGYAMRSELFSVGPIRHSFDEDVLKNAPAPLAGRSLEINWDGKRYGPPPLYKNAELTVGVDKGGRVLCFTMSVFDITAVRLAGSPAKIEAVLQINDDDWNTENPSRSGPKRFVYLMPAYTDLDVHGDFVRGTDMMWAEGVGVVLAALHEEAGDDLTAMMAKPSKSKGTPVENSSDFRFMPGQEGWRLYESIPKIESLWFGDCVHLIPESQYICLPMHRIHDESFESKEMADVLVTDPGKPWLFPQSNARHLKNEEISGLSSLELWRARNEIFARHGLIFRSPRGKTYAQSLGDSYTPVTEEMDAITAKLNVYEKANVDAIVQEEEKN